MALYKKMQIKDGEDALAYNMYKWSQYVQNEKYKKQNVDLNNIYYELKRKSDNEYYELKRKSDNLISKNQELEKKLENVINKNEELEEMIKYMAGGAVYQQAKEDFEELKKN